MRPREYPVIKAFSLVFTCFSFALLLGGFIQGEWYGWLGVVLTATGSLMMVGASGAEDSVMIPVPEPKAAPAKIQAARAPTRVAVAS